MALYSQEGSTCLRLHNHAVTVLGTFPRCPIHWCMSHGAIAAQYNAANKAKVPETARRISVPFISKASSLNSLTRIGT